jgi:glucose/arabinose dehydrogenase
MRRRLPALLLVIAGLATALTACFPPAEPGAPALIRTVWVSGHSKLWDLAFMPGFFPPVYTENNTGTIYARIGDSEPARVLGTVSTFDAGFNNSGEGGLMGIAIDPGYDAGSNKRAYVCYSTTSDNRVARFDLDPFAAPDARISNWTPIVTGMPHNDFHDGCRVRFQPGSGALFVTMGDAGLATGPQSPTVLAGKVLRIDTNGNPWPGNVSGSRWYTRGHRNPQGITFRPGTNDPYSIEHGPDVNDEVNKLVNGGNGGWNPNDGAGNYDQSVPMTDPSLANPPYNAGPIMTPVWVSGNETVAPSGGTFLTGAKWKAWNGALAVGCLKFDADIGQRLLIMHLSADGTTLTEPAVSTLTLAQRLRSVVEGPDGDMYIVTDGDNGTGEIWKIAPV